MSTSSHQTSHNEESEEFLPIVKINSREIGTHNLEADDGSESKQPTIMMVLTGRKSKNKQDERAAMLHKRNAKRYLITDSPTFKH